jgi:nitrate/nitrite transporter NarK
MNKAQKREWLILAISIATLLTITVAAVFVHINNIDVFDLSKPTRFRLLSLAMTIPLILLVIMSLLFPKKDFDERDRQIDNKAAVFGGIGALIALGGAALFLLFTSRACPVKSLQIPFVAYLVCFVYFLVLSIAALIQYGRCNKGENL